MKKQSTLSIFSKRNYSAHEYYLNSKILIKLLVYYCNIIIKKGFYLTRWLQVLDVIIEKGKKLVLGKLRTIQLIEANSQLLMRIFTILRNSGAIE